MVNFNKFKLKNKLSGTSSSSSNIRNKFKKREQSVLDDVYENRNERSKSGFNGRPIFNQELMAEFGIEDFQTTVGDRFFEIMPISFSPSVPYFKELSVHFGVGLSQDAFICMNRYKKQRCYRCEKQQVMWKEFGTPGCKLTKDDVKKLYPADRTCYLLWERTKELLEGSEPDYTFKLWASPKSKVHAEIQEKARNKISRQTLDISDVRENGEGKTVSLTIVKQGDYPDYKAFDLIDRDSPIPDAILEKLDKILTAAEEAGYTNAIEMFFNMHEYDELKESMDTENELNNNSEDNDKQDSCDNSSSKQTLKQLLNKSKDECKKEKNDEEIVQELQQVQEHLENICTNSLKWKMWLKTHGYEEALQIDPSEAIPAIIDDMYEKAISNL